MFRFFAYNLSGLLFMLVTGLNYGAGEGGLSHSEEKAIRETGFGIINPWDPIVPIPLANLPSALHDSNPVEDSEWYESWIGLFVPAHTNWIYHLNFGFVEVRERHGFIYLYDPEIEVWFATKPNLTEVFYMFGRLPGWYAVNELRFEEPNRFRELESGAWVDKAFLKYLSRDYYDDDWGNGIISPPNDWEGPSPTSTGW